MRPSLHVCFTCANVRVPGAAADAFPALCFRSLFRPHFSFLRLHTSQAEAQCAWLDQEGLVDGVVTDDNDVFLFGGEHVYRHIFDNKRYGRGLVQVERGRQTGAGEGFQGEGGIVSESAVINRHCTCTAVRIMQLISDQPPQQCYEASAPRNKNPPSGCCLLPPYP